MTRKITFDEFFSHWYRDSKKQQMPLVSRFGYNVVNFTTEVGEFSKHFFEQSFSYGGFYGTGNKWAPRKSKKGNHPLLLETTTLIKSFTKEGEAKNEVGETALRNKTTKLSASYTIKTNETHSRPLVDKKKRRKDTYAIRKATGYAAIHNTDPKKGLYYSNQYRKSRPEHRQFMGHNATLNEHVKANFIPILFKGFPFP